MTTHSLFGDDVSEESGSLDKSEDKPERFRYELFKHFIPDLTSEKKNILKNDVDSEKDLVPFIINKFFSMDSGDVFLANEMNRYCNLPKRMVYDFYIYGATKRRRYNKWAKNNKDDLVEFLKTELNISHQKAMIEANLIDDASIQQLIDNKKKGGIEK